MKKLSTTVEKPWGAYYDLAEEKGKWHLKIIEVRKGQRLSLQKHSNRSELWIIAEGEARVTKGDEILELKTGETVSFGKNEAHRLEGITDVVMVELSSGEHDEADIIRLADDYGR